MNRCPSFRRFGVAPVAAFALAAVVAVGALLPSWTAAQEETPTQATEPGVLDVPVAEIDCATGAAATAAAGSTDASFTIVSAESEARYRAQEELAGRGAAEAVGRTNAFIGQILFDAEGTPLACTRFDVDLRTLQSDEARRDNYLYNNTLQTERFPLATFILTEVEGLDDPLAEGEETTFTLIGNLTVHGVTKLVAWDTTVTLDGDTLEGAAATTFDMPDFGIEPPVVGPVLGLDETVALEVHITAERAA